MKRHLLRTMLLLCALVAGGTSAWANTAEFAPSNFSGQGTSGSGSAISATVDGVTFACDKGFGTDQIRCYSGGKITISSLNTITAISFTFSGSYTGGMEASYTSLSTTSWEKTLSSQARITAVTVTYTPSSDPSSNVAFANATASLDLKDAASFTQTATTASGYSETAGASVTYSMTANTAEATIDENTGEVTPTQAGSVTVQASAAAIAGHFAASTATYTLTVTDTREFTVICHIGNNNNNVVRASGATLSLDDPAAIGGMSFAGWSSNNNVAAPTWVANTSKVTGNMELYAMFEAAAGEYSYHLVEADQADWRGDYLIAYSTTVFADGRVGGDSGIGKAGTKANPGTKLSGKIVDVTWGDTYNITIEAKDDNKLSDGYLMTTKDGQYNYQTSNNNGIASTTTRATAANYPLSITFNNSSNIAIANSAGAVFHYNSGSSGYFRFYKDGGQNNVYLYKRTEDAAPVYSLGLTATITLNAACTDGAGNYYGTYSNSNAFIVPSGLTASAVKIGEGNTLTLMSYDEGDVVKANTGVLVSSTTSGDKTIILTDETGTEKAGNLLKPSGDAGINAAAMATAAPSCKYYRLTMHNGTDLGFWWGAAFGAAFDIAANKAYLAVPDGTPAREGFTFGDETNNIKNLTPTFSEGEGVVYDLQGRRVVKATKGLYIVNGCKVIVK